MVVSAECSYDHVCKNVHMVMSTECSYGGVGRMFI